MSRQSAYMWRAPNGVEVRHYHNGELVGTSRRFDERLTIALMDRRDHFMRGKPPSWHEAGAFESDDFRGLLKRVEEGSEAWANEEIDRSGWDEVEAASPGA